MPRSFVFALSLVPLGACAVVGPDYQAPKINLAETYVGAGATPAENLSALRWWTELNDSTLNALIDRGLAQNLSIQSALAAIRSSESQLAATGVPSQVTGGLSADAARAGGNSLPTSNTRTATVNATLALDLFGGIARGQQQAQAAMEAAQYDAGTARLAYLSSLAGNYIDARYYQESLELTRQSIANQERLYTIAQQERDAGSISDLQVAQSRAALQNAQAQQPDLLAAFDASVFGIATLLAEPANPLMISLQRGASQPLPQGGANVGIPANLLRNRPDVLAAERRLAAASAAIGVAEASLYPSISLSGSIASRSGADSWSFGPGLSFPIFNQPALTARRDAAVTAAEQAQIAWRAAVLQAVRDVQSAQSAYQQSLRKVANLKSVVASDQEVLKLTQAAFDDGGVALTDLIDATQSVTQARLSLAAAVHEAGSNWLRLKVASGAGWAVGQ